MNRFLALLTVASFVLGGLLLSALLPGCTDLKEGDIVTSPTDNPTNDDFSQDEAAAARMQTWIDQMDPFVSQASDGSYSLDWQGFLRSISGTHPEGIRYLAAGGQPSEDAKVIQQLKDGIPMANAALQQNGSEKAASPQGWACWTYWWGRRCCYWGSTGWWIVDRMHNGDSIPPWGWLINPYSQWAEGLMRSYNGFCANGSWAGGIWLTAP